MRPLEYGVAADGVEWASAWAFLMKIVNLCCQFDTPEVFSLDPLLMLETAQHPLNDNSETYFIWKSR